MKKNLSNLLTILIPTKNRSDFLSRQLKSFEIQKCPYKIIIGDSSDEKELEKNRKRIKESNLEIEHIYKKSKKENSELVGWQNDPIIKDLPKSVATPYLCFLADDDFFFIKSINKAIVFLEKNSSYSFVTGNALMLFSDFAFSQLSLKNLSIYKQRAYTNHDPIDRFESLHKSYTVVEYGISRTNQFIERWEIVLNSNISNLNGEFLNTSLIALQGRIHKLNDILFCRQAHKSMTSQTKIRDNFLLKNIDLPRKFNTLNEFFGSISNNEFEIIFSKLEQYGSIKIPPKSKIIFLDRATKGLETNKRNNFIKAFLLKGKNISKKIIFISSLIIMNLPIILTIRKTLKK